MRRLALAIVAAMALGAADAAAATSDRGVCGVETARQERLLAVPDRLLHAISLVESGRWDDSRKESFAWPWTVTAEGEGHFLPGKAEAVALVRRLQARGVTNIDVGCMQVNLQAHPDAFPDLDAAFDPATNVAYAARFLVGLHTSTGSWPTAGAYYHSQTPALAAAYKAKLIAAWNGARGRPDDRLDALGGGVVSAALFDLVPDATIPDPAASAATVEARRKAAKQRTEAERAEAKRIADAYRQARIEEYRLRKINRQQGML